MATNKTGQHQAALALRNGALLVGPWGTRRETIEGLAERADCLAEGGCGEIWTTIAGQIRESLPQVVR